MAALGVNRKDASKNMMQALARQSLVSAAAMTTVRRCQPRERMCSSRVL